MENTFEDLKGRFDIEFRNDSGSESQMKLINEFQKYLELKCKTTTGYLKEEYNLMLFYVESILVTDKDILQLENDEIFSIFYDILITT